jgi:phage shock protein C
MTDFRHKKLRRSTTDRFFAGVVGGVAEYFEIDSTALRVAWILLVIFTGVFPGVIAYILMAMVMPPAETTRVHDVPPHNDSKDN